MKRASFLTAVVLGMCLSAQAALFEYSSSGTVFQWSKPTPAEIPGYVLPDGNLSGWSSTLDLTGAGLPTQITDVAFKLNISGGYNGDLYAYLTFGDVLVPLLNRVGRSSSSEFGSSTAGMNVTLQDGAANIHGATAAPLTGTFAADGRLISPLAAKESFDADPTIGFYGYDGLNPNGIWTLFIADVSSGSVSTLQSYELQITAVPEPVNVAMGIFGGLFAAGLLYRRFKAQA